jgi:hypothetical protein
LLPNNDKILVLVSGAWRCTLTSSLTSTIVKVKYHRTTVVSFREQGEKQIPSIIFEATRWCSSWTAAQYSPSDYSELISVYSKDKSFITGKWWPNPELIKKCIYFTTVSIKADSHIACRGHAAPMPFPCLSPAMPFVNSHIPCRAPVLHRQCRVLHESPRGSRKSPNC